MAKKSTVKKKGTKKPSSQIHLPIAEIKENTVVLKDGTLRSILMTSSINFALKSEDEQNALISSYVGFLNSIDYPLQIIVQSRQLEIGPYMERLSNAYQTQTNELLRQQINDYRSFVAELIEIGQIMTKRFYVVVPYDPLSNKKKSFWSRTQEVFKPALTIRLKEQRFMDRKEDLDLRVRQVVSGLQSVGLQVVPLDTQALIELFYTSYNPQISFSQQLQPMDKINIEEI